MAPAARLASPDGAPQIVEEVAKSGSAGAAGEEGHPDRGDGDAGRAEAAEAPQREEGATDAGGQTGRRSQLTRCQLEHLSGSRRSPRAVQTENAIRLGMDVETIVDRLHARDLADASYEPSHVVLQHRSAKGDRALGDRRLDRARVPDRLTKTRPDALLEHVVGHVVGDEAGAELGDDAARAVAHVPGRRVHRILGQMARPDELIAHEGAPAVALSRIE